ncbi:MAG: DUF2690 domain-containing protein [Anaerolineales bacterium]
MKKRLITVFAMSVLLLSLFTNTANARPNAVCSGSNCNGIDPQNSGCTAVTMAFKQKDGTSGSGTVQADLRYSSNCNSKWSRATNIYPGAIRKLRARLTDNSSAYLNVEPAYSSSSYAQLWTNMHSGSTALCSIASQGLVGGSYDATTTPACY